MTKFAQPMMDQVINSSITERLSLEARPPIPYDHMAHICQLVQMGQTCLAADHLLFPEINGVLSRTVTGVIRQLNVLFSSAKPIQGESEEAWKEKVRFRQYAYEALTEMGLNFCGLESRWLREREKKECLPYILNTLDEWENLEREEGETSVASAVIRRTSVGRSDGAVPASTSPCGGRLSQPCCSSSVYALPLSTRRQLSMEPVGQGEMQSLHPLHFVTSTT